MKLNKKGFTLIELLAVIVILGLLMAIAIPSVTRYITQSRLKTLVNSIDGFIQGVTTAVNDNEFGALSNGDKLYYIPVSNEAEDSCISLEKGGTDPFGEWDEAYVVVHYDAAKYSYDYFFTFIDKAGYGMALTKSDAINTNGKQIVNPAPVAKADLKTQVTAVMKSGEAATAILKSDGTTAMAAADVSVLTLGNPCTAP
jgi:prepilin-type N-terminal cleavage/methylation domain-containing protein